LEYIIKTYSNENDMILDNTAGVFTTAIAAKINNRNFICIEKDKNYYDMGIKLYNNYNYKIHSKFF
jgi:site-specific DNA-methyltransferase (adenine-specific)